MVSSDTLTVAGTVAAGSTVTIFNGSTALGQAIASLTGSWSFDTTLTNGSFSITARAGDLAGNTSSASATSYLIVGDSSDNTFSTGTILNEIVVGYTGNDLLTGGTGTDRLLGGVGDDIYTVNSTGDLTIEGLNEGNDTVQASLSWTLSSNLEALTLTGITNLNGTGNDLDNVIIGNSGSNRLTGGKSNDILYLGDDSTVDTVVYNAGDGMDTVFQFNRGTGGDRLQINGFTSNDAIDVVSSGSSTFFSLHDDIAGFGNGQALLDLLPVTSVSMSHPVAQQGSCSARVSVQSLLVK
jgi:Ca2+-binding RTX toxin-like protein